jgi:CubicO group peptidase (beta-lactamase class C family)
VRRPFMTILAALLLLVSALPSTPVSVAELAVLAAPAPPAAPAARTSIAADPSFGAALDGVTDRALDEGRIVGAVVLVAEDGHLVYHRAAGLADREAGTPIREESVFRLASMTKPIVSAATLALVEQGRLRLDDPVTRYIPEFRPKLADGREPVITIRYLLSHTAGLDYPFNEPDGGPYHRAGVSNGFDQPGLSITENLARIASTPLLYEPGTAWSYSVAHDVLGEVVARAAGEPLPQVIERTVTGPLTMADTGFAIRDHARLVTAYGDGAPGATRMGETFLLASFGVSPIPYAPNRAADPASYPSGGAGMVGTAGDYLRFLDALRAGGEPVLTADSVKALTASTTGELGVGGPMPGWGFGFGLSVLDDPQAAGTPQSVGTWQWGGVYGSSWFVDPSRRLTVVVITNTAVAGMIGTYPDAIRDAVYGAR